MELDDLTVRTYFASRDLYRLYGAYQATTRAEIAATEQTRRHVERRSSSRPQASIDLAEIDRVKSLLQHTDAVFNDRRRQLRRRLLELLEVPRVR